MKPQFTATFDSNGSEEACHFSGGGWIIRSILKEEMHGKKFLRALWPFGPD